MSCEVNVSIMNVLYSLTADNVSHHFIGMTRLSALSVSLRSPGARIVVFVDGQTHAAVADALSRAFAGLAELRIVDVEDALPTTRNRCIRTQLRMLWDGPFLYLDGDTLIRADLKAIFDDAASGAFDLAAVANHNDPAMAAPANEIAMMRACGWTAPTGPYLNAGVQFWADTPKSRKAGRLYHDSWRTLVRVTGRGNDQQAFNHAVDASGATVRLLPGSYNAQLESRMKPAFDAKVWHFFYDHIGSIPTPKTVWHDALKTQPGAEALTALLDRDHPWIVENLVAAAIVSAARRDDSFLGHGSWRRLWLAGAKRAGASKALIDAALYAPRAARRWLRRSPGLRRLYFSLMRPQS